jgi:hypothetical protein
MTPNKRDLKAYSRFDGTGRIVPGSTVLRRNKPKVGNWKETQAYECCVPSTETSYRCCIAIQAIADSETGQYGFTLQVRDGGPNLTGSIQWTSTVSESFSLVADGSNYDFIYDLEGLIVHTVYLCIDNPSQLQDFEIGDGGVEQGTAVAISNLQKLEGFDEWDGDDMAFTSLDFTGITTMTQLYNGNTGLQHINITGCVNLDDVELEDNDLTEASVNHVLITLDDNGLSDGYVYLSGGTSATPSGLGLAAQASLVIKGWTVFVNP